MLTNVFFFMHWKMRHENFVKTLCWKNRKFMNVGSWNSPELAEASFVWSEVTVVLNRLSIGEFLGLIPNLFDGGERSETGLISPEVTTPSSFCLFAVGETSAISKGEYSAKKKSRFFKLFLHVSKSHLFFPIPIPIVPLIC